MASKPPLPPFIFETAVQKASAPEDGWNNRDPQMVSVACSDGSAWRNRAEFFKGRDLSKLGL